MNRRRALLGLVALLVAGVAGAGFWIGPYLVDGDEYAHVESIEKRDDYRDPSTIAAAWQLPVAMTYRHKPYEFQTHPSFCAPASAANLLRSLGADFTQLKVIEDTPYDPWFGILIGGLTLDELADLMRKRTPHTVTVVRAESLAAFREQLAHANDLSRRYIVNFHRGPLFGRGHGHFSPILGYLADQDLVFVGDVNEDYRPFLVSSERLWNAIDTVDGDSGQRRGLLVVASPH